MKSKETKRKEAAIRQSFYNGLTTQQKLEMAYKAPGNCKKQIRKLEAQLAKEGK